MKIKRTVHIDMQSQKEKNLVEHLRAQTDIVSSSYVPIEVFRKEAKKRAEEFLNNAMP